MNVIPVINWGGKEKGVSKGMVLDVPTPEEINVKRDVKPLLK